VSKKRPLWRTRRRVKGAITADPIGLVSPFAANDFTPRQRAVSDSSTGPEPSVGAAEGGDLAVVVDQRGSVGRAAAAYLPAYALPGVLGLVSIPLLARLLGPSEFGIYAVALAVHGIALTVIADPTSNSLRRLFATAERQRQETHLVMAGLGLALSLSAVVLIAAAAVSLAVALLGEQRLAVLIAVVAISTCLFALFQYLLTTQYVRERVRETSLAQVAHALLKTTGLVVGAAMAGVAVGAFAGYAVALVGLLTFYSRWVRRERGRMVDRTRWLELVTFGGPLIVVSLSWVVLAGFDRVALEVVDGASAAGRYGFVYLIADGALSLFAMALHYAAYPRLARLWEATEADLARATLRRVVGYFLIVAATVVAAAAIVGPDTVSILAGEDFEISAGAIMMVLIGIAVFRLADFEAMGFHLARDSSGLARRYAIAAGVGLPLALALIVELGIDGAALSTLLAYLGFWICIRWRNPLAEVTQYPASGLIYVIVCAGATTGVALSLPLALGLAITTLVLPAALALGLLRLEATCP
jgi:O-antigen/teichoic acid export membrane protein